MKRQRTTEELLRHAAASKARNAIRSMQQQISSRLVAMTQAVEALLEHMTEKEALHFLHAACEMDLSEAGAYVKASRNLKDSRDLLKKSRAGFALMKSLATADHETRVEALSRMRDGATLGARDVSAIRTHLRHQNGSVYEARRREEEASARRAARTRMRQAMKEVDRLVGEVMVNVDRLRFDRVSPADRSGVHDLTRRTAAEALPLFELVYGRPDAGPEALLRSEARDIDLVHPALTKLAGGEFGGAHGFGLGVPEDLSHGGPYLGRCLRGATTAEPLVRWQGDGMMAHSLARPAPKLRVVELCAGAGGMALGLERAGYECVALFENDKDAAATLRKNREAWRVIEDDIRSVDFKPYRNQRIDLLVGGLPCQPYSIEGHGLGKDDRRDLLPEGARAVEEIQPDAFLFENVAGLLHARHSDHLGGFLKRLRKAGYSVQITRMEAEDYGVPQERTRIMIVGMRKAKMAAFSMPPRFPELRTNIGDAIGDLMAANGWSGAAAWADDLRNRLVEKNGVEYRGVLASTVVGRKGGSRDKERERWASKGIDIRNVADSAPTQAQADAFGEGFLPALTLRMRARLQAFPDDWIFLGGKDSAAKQIGNAVPPPVATAIGLAVRAALQDTSFDYYASLRSETYAEQKVRRRAFSRSVPPLAPTLQAPERSHESA